MAKLYVDDIRTPKDEEWTVARTVLSAIQAIAQFDFEVISLDHDISHQVGMGELSRPYPCADTFASVAYFIGQRYTGKVDKPKIILHTSNIVGAEKMRAILAGYGLESSIEQTGIANRLEMEVK